MDNVWAIELLAEEISWRDVLGANPQFIGYGLCEHAFSCACRPKQQNTTWQHQTWNSQTPWHPPSTINHITSLHLSMTVFTSLYPKPNKQQISSPNDTHNNSFKWFKKKNPLTHFRIQRTWKSGANLATPTSTYTYPQSSQQYCLLSFWLCWTLLLKHRESTTFSRISSILSKHTAITYQLSCPAATLAGAASSTDVSVRSDCPSPQESQTSLSPPSSQ